MDRKDIIIIILSLIIIALLAIGAYNQAREDQIIYHTVNITDTFSLDVPISDNVTKTQIEDGSQYLYTQESYKLGAEQITLSNHTVWYNRKDKNYIAFFSPENTNDNVIIVCKDNETMARMISTVRY